MHTFTKLFEKNYIGTMELKNRICFGEQAPQAVPIGGALTQENEDFYVARAKGGCALVMVGGMIVDYSGLGSRTMCLIDDDERHIPALAKMAKAVHAASPGVKMGVQIHHMGRQLRPDSGDAPPNMHPVAPSPVKFKPGIVPHELTVDEILHLENQFIKAAKRVQKAGCDCVQIHGAHGYLINQFMSPFTNLRTDQYGGSVENKIRFACEIIQGIKKECGADFPVLIKINAVDIHGDDDQMTPELAMAYAQFLEKAGVDEIHISGGQHESPGWATVSPYYIPKAPFADYAAQVKKVVNIPVGVINRINDPVLADELVEQGKVDLVWMLRPLIADPELPNKARAGKLDQIRTCIACNVCIDMLTRNEAWLHELRCAVNPDAWREGVTHIEPSLRTKKVLVVGAGPAGMEAARIAAEIGHDVTLWEKDAKTGGQLNLASIPPLKQEVASVIRYYDATLKELGVKVELGKEATAAAVKEFKPDVIIIASGSSSSVPPIPGVDLPLVVDARNVLAGTAKTGDKVVIIGGGEVGMETAQWLAEQGKKLTLVEMLPEIGETMVRDAYDFVYEEIVKHGVEILTSTKVQEIAKDGVLVVGSDGQKRTLAADTVIIATGAKPNTKVQDDLQGLAREIYLAGDCLVPCDIRMSVHQGNITGRMLY